MPALPCSGKYTARQLRHGRLGLPVQDVARFGQRLQPDITIHEYTFRLGSYNCEYVYTPTEITLLVPVGLPQSPPETRSEYVRAPTTAAATNTYIIQPTVQAK